MRQVKARLKTLCLLIVCIASAIANTHASSRSRDTQGDGPEAEFQMARVKYRTFGGGGSHGYYQPWWAIDYPLAEEHFFAALRRTTNIQIADEERHLELSDDRIFEYPFFFLQQPGQGNWRPTPNEAARLREYCLRGGFLLVDDLHAEWAWAIFEKAIKQVFPDRPIVEIPEDDPLMHVFFDLDTRMRMRRWILNTVIAGMLLVIVSAASLTRAQQTAPDLILSNGKIITVDERFTIAQALAIKGDRIVAVGANSDITRLAAPGTRRIDLSGRS